MGVTIDDLQNFDAAAPHFPCQDALHLKTIIAGDAWTLARGNAGPPVAGNLSNDIPRGLRPMHVYVRSPTVRSESVLAKMVETLALRGNAGPPAARHLLQVFAHAGRRGPVRVRVRIRRHKVPLHVPGVHLRHNRHVNIEGMLWRGMCWIVAACASVHRRQGTGTWHVNGEGILWRGVTECVCSATRQMPG